MTEIKTQCYVTKIVPVIIGLARIESKLAKDRYHLTVGQYEYRIPSQLPGRSGQEVEIKSTTNILNNMLNNYETANDTCEKMP